LGEDSNEIPQALSYGCPYGAVQAFWAQDPQLISIDIIESVATLADINHTISRRVLSRIERSKIQWNGGRMHDENIFGGRFADNTAGSSF
jgi:hypothetical protein